jgi:AcrR family transcriptional regulator
VDDIAKKARVAKGTIYNYFQNKEELFRKVFQDEGIHMISRMRDAVKGQSTPQRKLREMIIAKIKYYKDFCLIHGLESRSG